MHNGRVHELASDFATYTRRPERRRDTRSGHLCSASHSRTSFLLKALVVAFILNTTAAAQENVASPDAQDLGAVFSPSELREFARENGVTLRILSARAAQQSIDAPSPLPSGREAVATWLSSAFRNTITARSIGSEPIRIFVLSEDIDAARAATLISGTRSDTAAPPVPAGPLQVVANIDQAPEIIRLSELSAAQRGVDLEYLRLIGPPDSGVLYRFRVRYSDRTGRMMPYQREGAEPARSMESFSNFYTIERFILRNVEALSAIRFGDRLRLTLADSPGAFIDLVSRGERLAITLNSETEGPLPPFQVQLMGTHDDFAVRTQLRVNGQQVMISDAGAAL